MQTRGKSHAEVSQQLEIPSSTVNDQIVKATKIIKEKLFKSSNIAFTLIATALLLENAGIKSIASLLNLLYKPLIE